jgi:hypothetical protein
MTPKGCAGWSLTNLRSGTVVSLRSEDISGAQLTLSIMKEFKKIPCKPVEYPQTAGMGVRYRDRTLTRHTRHRNTAGISAPVNNPKDELLKFLSLYYCIIPQSYGVVPSPYFTSTFLHPRLLSVLSRSSRLPCSGSINNRATLSLL